MKIRLTLFFMLALTALLTLPGNKNGRASQSGKGNTGAPGDETLSGAPYTCSGCHNGGAITANVGISILDTSGAAVTQYLPGQLYTARVTVNATGTALAGYGFQMIALRDNGNTDLDGFSDVNPNNYKIATISNGRTYAEHANVSTSNTFNVRWTAPAAGTGSVSFYAAGNGVNNNGNSNGDGASNTALTIQEQIVLNSENPVQTAADRIQVSPNPLSRTAQVTFETPVSGTYHFVAYHINGEIVWTNSAQMQAGSARYALPAENWAPGTYFLSVKGPQSSQSVKVLKL